MSRRSSHYNWCMWEGRKEHVHPIKYPGAYRNACLGWTVDRIMEWRCFSHLSESALRSYLLYVSERGYEQVVRTDGPNAPFYQDQVWRTDVTECSCCHHREYRHRVRKVLVAPDAPTTRGREAYERLMHFSVQDAMVLVAWRLGVSCIFCGSYCGARRSLSDHATKRRGGAFDILCGGCARHHKLDIRAWRREHGYDATPPEEWLLLKAVERARKRAGRKRPRSRPAPRLAEAAD